MRSLVCGLVVVLLHGGAACAAGLDGGDEPSSSSAGSGSGGASAGGADSSTATQGVGGDGVSSTSGPASSAGSGGDGGSGGASSTVGASTTSTASGGPIVVEPGDLVITEIMANPDATSDTYGEWIEIYNATSVAIDLQGLVFRHEPNTPAAVHVIATSVIAPALDYVVLGKSSDAELNGGVLVSYAYPGDIGFTNTGDYLAIERADATIIDHTSWGSDAPQGASLSLDPAFSSASQNDDETHFCPGIAPLGSGDRGSPGWANPPCN